MDLKLDDALKLAKKTLKEGSAEEAKRIYKIFSGGFQLIRRQRLGLRLSPVVQLARLKRF